MCSKCNMELSKLCLQYCLLMDGVVLGCCTYMPVLYIPGQQVGSQDAVSPEDLASLVLQCCWMGCTPRVGAEGRRRLSWHGSNVSPPRLGDQRPLPGTGQLERS